MLHWLGTADCDVPATQQDGEENITWWLDDHTKDMLERVMQRSAGADGKLTFTVRDGAPLSFTKEEVRKLPAADTPQQGKGHLRNTALCRTFPWSRSRVREQRFSCMCCTGWLQACLACAVTWVPMHAPVDFDATGLRALN